MTFFSIFQISEKKKKSGKDKVQSHTIKEFKQHWQKCFKPFRDCKPDYLKRNFQRKLVPNSMKHENISAHFFEQPQNSRRVLLWGNHNSLENALGNVAVAPADILASALPLAKFKH